MVAIGFRSSNESSTSSNHGYYVERLPTPAEKD